MPMDRFSPVAPAHVRVLVLPVGSIDRPRYLSFLARLQKEAWIVNLADIERYVKDDNLLLSPKAFPNGSILYNYSTSVPNPQQEHLSPFELFRAPLLVLGVVDKQGGQDEGDEEEVEPAASVYLRERHPRVVHRQLFILESADSSSSTADSDAIRIPNAATPGDEALQDAMRQVSARFLKELSTYTRAMQASPSVQTPGQTARSLQRTTSQREHYQRPSSGRSTPTKNTEPTTPVDSSGGVKLPPLDRGSPATSFDQIASANNDRDENSRPDSRTSNKDRDTRRASSQDRVSVQGFGSGMPKDKHKHQRGKARVGIVVGSLYMIAGQWSEGLRILADNTNKVRNLSDDIWYAKGLENIVVCLLLQSWAELPFQVPLICYTPLVNLPSDSKPADAAQLAPVRRLSSSLPDLLKRVLSLYRFVEGSLELPCVLISEATIRFSKLLAALHNAGGELDHSTLDQFIGSSKKAGSGSGLPKSLPRGGGPSKTTIDEMLYNAWPTNEDTLQVSDQIAILAGTASIYALLQMHRKKANALRALVGKLRTALTQARKRGAAEVGIHPAASLPSETGADVILALTQDSKGVYKMMAEIARVYGVKLSTPSNDTEDQAQFQPGFGSDSLKVSILRDFTAFCEATPDPYGVLIMTTGILSAFGPRGAVDVEAYRCNGVLTKDDQVRLMEKLAHSVGLSKHVGLPHPEPEYWDRFLVRGVEFVPQRPNLEIITYPDQPDNKPGAVSKETKAGGGNPLLYDPNTKRPESATKPQSPRVLVAREMSDCLITLQNPYDVPVDVEYLSFGTGDEEIRTTHLPFTLHPMRLQQVTISVYPLTPGQYKIDHIRAKISGCTEQKFPIVSKAWTPEESTLVKDLGQDTVSPEVLSNAEASLPEHIVVEVQVIEPQPLLIFEDMSLNNSSVMLLDGEKRKLNAMVINVSKIPLTIFKQTVGRTHRLTADADLDTPLSQDGKGRGQAIDVKPGDRYELRYQLPGKGKANIARTDISILYCRQQESPQYARRLGLSLHFTVNAALQAQHLRATPLEDGANTDDFMLSFDLRNAWPEPLRYLAAPPSQKDGSKSRVTKAWGELKPGQVERVDILMPRIILSSVHDLKATKLTKSLLSNLSVTWTGEDRTGKVDLSDLTLSTEELGIVTKSWIHLKLELSRGGRDGLVEVGSFVTLIVKISPLAGFTEPLLVKMVPFMVNTAKGDRTAQPAPEQRIIYLDGSGKEEVQYFQVFPLFAGRMELEVTARSSMGAMNYDGSGVIGIARCKIDMMAAE